MLMSLPDEFVTPRTMRARLSNHLFRARKNRLELAGDSCSFLLCFFAQSLHLRSRNIDRVHRLPHKSSRDPKQPAVGSLDRFSCLISFFAECLFDLVASSRDASAHVDELARKLDPGVDKSPHVPVHDAHRIFEQTAVGRISDRGFDHRRVDPHSSTSSCFLFDGDSYNSIEKRAKRRTLEKLVLSNHRLGVGDLGAVDSAEATVNDVARHFPFELFADADESRLYVAPC